MSKVDDFGTPDAYNHYAVGWAHALCTPYQWTKQIASHWGGTRNGTIVHWPKGLSDKGTVRDQFHHVIDVAPTILEAAGIPAPLYVKGIQQAPLEGVSMLPTLRTAAPESHVVQYFEILGNRGSTTTAGRRVPNTHALAAGPATIVRRRHLGALRTRRLDPVRNLAAEQPDKLAELQRLWLIEAVKYNVVPLDDRSFERINPDIAGRPQLIRGNSQLLFPGMRVPEGAMINIRTSPTR